MKKILFTAICIITSLIVTAQNLEIDFNTTVSKNYIGNGVQWDPYSLDYGKGRVEISDADWQKIYSRLDWMTPGFVRFMFNTTTYVENGNLNKEKAYNDFKHILNYCQSRNVNVMFGDWGGLLVYDKTSSIDSLNLKHAVELVEYMVEEKGYSCIKYYNLINEPNGDWSTTNTSYNLWKRAVQYFYKNLAKSKAAKKVKMVGPDAAIWSPNEAWWIDSCRVELSKEVKLYDIHTYPSKYTVNSGQYTQIIKAYSERIPKGSQIVMGEIGLKFVAPEDKELNEKNLARAAAAKYASIEDSQMSVYDHSYGTDMADALFQNMQVGYSGTIIWMLDDAMHSKESPDKLKVWGFWNILGEECFESAKEEEVRPFYYAWSLLCRYIPQGSEVLKVQWDDENHRVRGVVTKKNGKYTIALVNSSNKTKTATLLSQQKKVIKNLNRYDYVEGKVIKKGDYEQLPNEKSITLDFSKPMKLEIPANSVIVFTNAL